MADEVTYKEYPRQPVTLEEYQAMLRKVDVKLLAGVLLDRINTPSENPWKRLYERMRECAAGYSQRCDSGSRTTKLDNEFEAIEADARALSK